MNAAFDLDAELERTVQRATVRSYTRQRIVEAFEAKLAELKGATREKEK